LSQFDPQILPCEFESIISLNLTEWSWTSPFQSEIARNGGPGHASVKAMLDAMQQDRA
jgi:hypothetical protein